MQPWIVSTLNRPVKSSTDTIPFEDIYNHGKSREFNKAANENVEVAISSKSRSI